MSLPRVSVPSVPYRVPGLSLRLGTATAAEAGVLIALLAVILATYLYRLDSLIIPGQDEGTYLYAARLIAEGKVPYEDFFLGHPPLLPYFFGLPFKLFGADIMLARLLYMVVVLLSAVPLYLIVKRLSDSSMVALLAVSLYTTGGLIVANATRTVLLEPFLNVFVIAAFALYIWRPDHPRLRFLIGVLLALALLVKLVAVVPAVMLVAADVFWPRPERRFLRDWSIACAGAALLLVPVAAVLLTQTDFFDAVVRSQLDRPNLPFALRRDQLIEESVRYPAIPLALLASLWWLRPGVDPRMRVVAITTLGQVALLFFAFRTFFGYYLVLVLPGVAIISAVVLSGLVRQLLGQRWQPALVAGVVLLAGIAPLGYAEVYHRYGEEHTSSPSAIVERLRSGEGYVYSQYPAFALWSDRDLAPWYYATDPQLPRITGQAGDEEFLQVFSGSDALVLWPRELRRTPMAKAYVEEHFQLVYQDAHWHLWVRSSASSGAGD